MRFFNTSGPCDPHYHYMLPTAERLPEAPGLIDRGGYFVVHAPRQTGKTTTLVALAHELTASGRYAALYFSCEAGEVAEDDYEAAQREVLGSIRRHQDELPVELQPPDPWPEATQAGQLATALGAWARACPRPLVLFFDEIDALRGPSLKSVLRQLREIYRKRPAAAPWSVVLCGLRDVRDYKAASGGDAGRLGTSSPFNIKVASLRLGDFGAGDVAVLYAQHTEETGQPFEPEAIERAFALTGGQPWLVNALAAEIVDKIRVPPPEPITVEHVEQAKERLILARATHLDSLVARLTEPRVRRVIEPIMAGTHVQSTSYNDDVSYARDLGLIALGRQLRVANPIYREVIARVLAESVEEQVFVDPGRFVAADGRLDMQALLAAFVEFWHEHGKILARGVPYHEVAPQLVFMAFCQRIVNSGGFVDREYGVGRGRIDVLIRWPYKDNEGKQAWQREAVELKVWRDKIADPLERGLAQLDEYLDTLGLQSGTLVIFDRRAVDPSASVEDREAEPDQDRDVAITPAHTRSGRAVTLVRA